MYFTILTHVCANTRPDTDKQRRQFCSENSWHRVLTFLNRLVYSSQLSYLYQAWHNLRQKHVQCFLGHSLDHFCLHFDCCQINGIVCSLDDGTKHFDALFRSDGSGQHWRGLLGRPDHLKREIKTESLLCLCWSVCVFLIVTLTSHNLRLGGENHIFFVSGDQT